MLSAETFDPHVGTGFALRGSAAPVELRLAAIERGPEQPTAPRPEPFSLTFTGPQDAAVPQGTYALEHQELGTVELFLVPRQPLADGLCRYEAVFN